MSEKETSCDTTGGCTEPRSTHNITLHSDFIVDLDVMALDIRREGDTMEATRVINIYNQKS